MSVIPSEELERFRSFVDRFSEVPDGEWQVFRDQAERQELRKGELFTSTGQEDHRIGFILVGIAKVYFIDPDGRESIRSFPKEGDPLACYASLILGQPALVDIRAIEDMSLLTLRYDQLANLFERHIGWQVLGRRVAESYMIAREMREREFLMYDAAKRYEHFLEQNPGLASRIPAYDLASYLGISPISLSRIKAARRSSQT